MASNFNTIRVTDEDFDEEPGYNNKKKYQSEFVPVNHYQQ